MSAQRAILYRATTEPGDTVLWAPFGAVWAFARQLGLPRDGYGRAGGWWVFEEGACSELAGRKTR